MDVKAVKGKLLSALGKYRYAVLVLVLGIVLMLLPNTTQEQTAEPVQTEAPAEELTVEQQLSSLLSKIQGAGRVEVMLSIGSGAQTIYQTDNSTSTGTDNTSVQSDTVTVTDADRNQTGLVIQVNPPVYLGAIIICEGADDPNVKLAIVDAVSKYTGLGTNKICVLKMK